MITSIVNRQEPTDKYFVVYGPKGFCKSVLEGEMGVVKVLISSLCSIKMLFCKCSHQRIWEQGSVLSTKRRCGRIILVPELTRDEAAAILLESFLNGSVSVDEFIANLMATAKRDLVVFPFKHILIALKEHLEGVPLVYFKSVNAST